MTTLLPLFDPLANLGVSVSNASFETQAYLLAQSASHTSRPIIFIARDDKRMASLAELLHYFAPTLSVITLPAWDCLPYDRVSPAHHIASKRVQALCQISLLAEQPAMVIVTTVNACLQHIPPLHLLKSHAIHLSLKQTINREALTEQLIHSGYLRAVSAVEAGEFALRGSVMDIIPAGSNVGYRIDFFGDEIETIRSFDPITQISHTNHRELDLIPTSEILLNQQTITQFRQTYRSLFNIMNQDDPLYTAISEGRHYAGMEHWLPLFYTHTETIFDYLPNAVICLDHLVDAARIERINTIQDYYLARQDAVKLDSSCHYHPITPELLYLTEKQWQDHLKKHPILSFSPYLEDRSERSVSLTFRTTDNLFNKANTTKENVFPILKEYIATERENHRKKHPKQGLKCIITCFSEGSKDRLKNILAEYDIHVFDVQEWSQIKQLSGKTIGLTILPLEQGFIGDGLLVLSEQDILGPRIHANRKKRQDNGQFLIEAGHLNEGELVVHKDHGIGRFEALETLVITDKKHDCLRIIYAGGDKFYLPVENIDLISRYGSDEEGVKLDKLGGLGWQQRKAKLKKRIKDIAEDLLKVAAARQLKTATVIEPLAGMYEEFCARFPYAETDDQLRSIEDVAQDLISGRPMDRLICGDVGFGKTEVALRAAFIAASSQTRQQVALIAPTTLLVQQHLKTFKERFHGFPFIIKGLSRLTPHAEAKKIHQELTDGKIDIIIGTHALLAKSIQFKQLGLMIVDEEQLFGVTQKERLKQLQQDVHVLSLSATPIPRTLQMSLTGIKELSLITTPPVDRLAIRSYIMPFDGVVIRNAILREHYRGGKSFVVVPRIKDLDKLEEQLKKIIPEVSFTKAHGQMAPTILENTMSDFYEGKYDVLLATNIIGSGLDLPTANTIIIYKSDMFGLAQLYQMRGRVGRSKVRAYAYFTTDPKKQLSKTALKRLDIMQGLDTLGAGFTLASHDMDLRGFGNLVGEEQSGHIREVGMELYQDMLKEAIENAKLNKNEPVPEEKFSPHIHLGISVLIPDTYILDVELRLGLYRRIAMQETETAIEDIAIEMIDRFGPLPEEVHHLLEVMKLKLLCIGANISKIDAGPKGVVISFHNDKLQNPDALIEYVTKHPTKTKLRGDQKLVLLEEWKNLHDKIKAMRNTINTISKIVV